MATPIRKVVISEFGDVSKVNVEQSSIDPPKAGEIQVAPIYSGFSGADIGMVSPLESSMPPFNTSREHELPH